MENEKLDEKLNKGVEEIRQIGMTKEEKAVMLRNIFSAQLLPRRSPFLSILHIQRFTYVSIIPVLAILFLSGGVVFASGRSLPGELLYPLKVNVLEPAHSSFLFSGVAQAKYASALAHTRLIEAETLAKVGKLDLAKQEKINTLLSTHTDNLNTALEKIKNEKTDKNNNDEAKEEIVTNFQADMNAHAGVLDIISGGKENKEVQVSKTARENAIKVRGSIVQTKNTNTSNDEKGEKYKKKKETTQSIIDKVDKNLGELKNDQSPLRVKVKDSAEAGLLRARKSLEDADNEDRGGDSEKAYSNLLDGEASAKETDILLDSGLKL